jgi:predicted MarR family transcription regulator
MSRNIKPATRSKRAPTNAGTETTEPRIVSSLHLVSEKSPELSEFEFGLIIASHAFARWMVRCMAAAGVKDMTPTDVLILHHVNHRDKEKKLADICFAINIEDAHVVSYSLKKSIGMELIQSAKRGKEVFFSTTRKGTEVCMNYRKVREACLMPGFTGEESENQRLGEVARLLRTVSGRYDQAARAATSF